MRRPSMWDMLKVRYNPRKLLLQIQLYPELHPLNSIIRFILGWYSIVTSRWSLKFSDWPSSWTKISKSTGSVQSGLSLARFQIHFMNLNTQEILSRLMNSADGILGLKSLQNRISLLSGLSPGFASGLAPCYKYQALSLREHQIAVLKHNTVKLNINKPPIISH
jgi:hypothetical protein